LLLVLTVAIGLLAAAAVVVRMGLVEVELRVLGGTAVVKIVAAAAIVAMAAAEQGDPIEVVLEIQGKGQVEIAGFKQSLTCQVEKILRSP
jgi:hypothetical protein